MKACHGMRSITCSSEGTVWKTVSNLVTQEKRVGIPDLKDILGN